jgi:hypothetical protein
MASLARWELGLIAEDVQTFMTYYTLQCFFAAVIGAPAN